MTRSACRLCGAETRRVLRASLRDREAEYVRCSRCEYLAVRRPRRFAGSDDDSPSPLDTGRLERCLRNSRTVSTLLWLFYGRGDRYLDYGGGHGLFTRRMRDLGFDFSVYDPHARNLHARGFSHEPEGSGAFRLVTLLEVIEHVRDPMSVIQEALDETGRGNLLLGTRLYGDSVPEPEWWYYMRSTGEHIGFFNRVTLEYLGERLELDVHTDGRSMHLLTDRDLPGWSVWFCLRHGHRTFRWIRPWMGSRTEDDLRSRQEAVPRDDGP